MTRWPWIVLYGLLTLVLSAGCYVYYRVETGRIRQEQFTDVVMSGIDGVELARRLQAMRPETKVLYMSGYTQQMMDTRNLRVAEAEFLHKPFGADNLARKVHQVLDS